MARLTRNQYDKKLVAAYKNKTLNIKIGTQAQLRSTLKGFGVDVPKGTKEYTFRGNETELSRSFNRSAFFFNIGGRNGGKKVYAGVQNAANTTKVIFSIGGVDTVKSKGKYLTAYEAANLGNAIDPLDPRRLINFGLRKDGTPRTGYTLGQCFFSYRFRSFGSRADYRYGKGKSGKYNSILDLTRIQIIKNNAKSGGVRSKGVRSIK